MADSPNTVPPEDEHGKKPFIRETITKPGKQGPGTGRVLLVTAAMAVVFGVIASLTFVLTRPWWESAFGEEESSESLTLEQDEASGESETAEAEESEQAETEVSENLESEMESLVDSMLEDNQADLEDYESIYDALYDVIIAANDSLVTVTAYSTDQDWFENEVESDEETCGVIVALTEEEILILTDSYLLEAYDSVQVTFGSYGSGTAYLKAMDSANGIAVIAVSAEEAGTGVTGNVSVITLGNSYTAVQGEFVLAIGRPLGYSRSISYGIISYIDSSVQGVDCMLRLIQTNITAGTSPRGMLLNTDGELVGWLTTSYEDNSVDGLLCAVSITDLKPTIEKLMNGENMAQLGIRGQNVTEDIAAENAIPEGVWITECLTDEPAYLAGMQQGDIITAIDETEIGTLRELSNCLALYSPGDTVTVTVQREGRDGYSAISFAVTLDAR